MPYPVYFQISGMPAQFVSDVKVPLLRIVNIEGEYGTTVHTSFCNMQYIPVKVNSFETIEMNIKNNQNENILFIYMSFPFEHIHHRYK